MPIGLSPVQCNCDSPATRHSPPHRNDWHSPQPTLSRAALPLNDVPG